MNKVVLITGVLGGIGATTAKLFHQNGWFVVGVDITDKPTEIKGVDLYFRADVSDNLAWENIAQQLSEKLKSLTAIVNNAAPDLKIGSVVKVSSGKEGADRA